MKEQREKSVLVEFKAESVRLRNEMESEKDPQAKRSLRFRLREAKFWERLMEELVFVLLLLILSGCIENTMRGAGSLIQGAGQFVSGVGKDVVRGTDGYSKEK